MIEMPINDFKISIEEEIDELEDKDQFLNYEQRELLAKLTNTLQEEKEKIREQG